ncbi:MAG: hypothetical protein OXC99_08945 [Chloroflexi bacterium]|nr:hypothetical protein [Chloroflexota bacterium]
MVSVPGFLLRRLYVKGSLRATENGLSFEMKNTLGSGYARGMHPLTIDGEEVPMENTTFTVDGRTVAFSNVNADVPFTLAMNRTTTIAASGLTLTPGAHKIGMAFEVQGLGVLRFDFTDAANDG